MSIKHQILTNGSAVELASTIQFYRNEGWYQVGPLVTSVVETEIEYAVQMEKEEHPPYMQDTGSPYRESPDAAEARERGCVQIPLRRVSPYDASVKRPVSA